jgi:serine protease Do
VADGADEGQGPGAAVVWVEPGSAAEKAELQPGMLIVEANHRAIASAAELLSVLRDAKSGATVLLRIQLGDGRALRALVVP